MKRTSKKTSVGYLILGILLIAIGVCFIAFHDSLKFLSIAIGLLLSVFAIAYGIFTLADTARGLVFALKITFAVMALICGIATAIFNERTIEILVGIFALLLIIDASFKLNTAIMSKRIRLSSWWIFLILAILTILGSFIVLRYPPTSAVAVSIILGTALAIDGASNVLTSVFMSKIKKRIKRLVYRSMSAKEKELERKKELREEENKNQGNEKEPYNE